MDSWPGLLRGAIDLPVPMTFLKGPGQGPGNVDKFNQCGTYHEFTSIKMSLKTVPNGAIESMALLPGMRTGQPKSM